MKITTGTTIFDERGARLLEVVSYDNGAFFCDVNELNDCDQWEHSYFEFFATQEIKAMTGAKSITWNDNRQEVKDT